MKNTVSIIQSLQTLIILGMLAFFTISMVASDDSSSEEKTMTAANWDYPGLGQITMFAGNFAPRGWAFCNGQLLAIPNNQALFSLLGTTYGGDGRTVFALPDLRGRVAMHSGDSTGPGLTSHPLGSRGGSETNVLNAAQLPPHSHTAQLEGKAYVSSSQYPDEYDPAGRYLGTSTKKIFGDNPNNARMGAIDMADLSVKLGSTGLGQSINNMQPFQAVNYIICISGTFPSRN